MVKKPVELEVVILAAGRGRRLEPVRLTHSKAMTPILGVPIIERLIQTFHSIGLKRFVVVRAPHDMQMENAVCSLNGYDNLEIRTCIQHEPKGPADALKCAKKLVSSDFILTSCDNLYPEIHFSRLIKEWQEHKPSAILTLSNIRPGDLNKAAGVKLRGKEVLDFKEKPGENSGDWDAISKFIFVLDCSLMDFIDRVPESKRGELEAQEAIRLMIDKLKPGRKPMGIFVQRYLHLTSAEDLLKITEHYLAEHRPYGVHPGAKVHEGAQIEEPVMIEKDAVVCEGAKIGPNVYIGAGARVGKKVKLSRCIVYPGAHIEECECRQSQVIICKSKG